MGFSFDDILTSLTSPDSISALITGGLGATAKLYAPEPQIAYGNTKEGFEAAQAAQAAQFAQEMELAKLKLAQGDGGASGAALAAAQLGARVNIAGLKEKALADGLSMQLQSRQINAQNLNQANQTRVNAAQGLGQAGLQGYGNMANLLASFRQ